MKNLVLCTILIFSLSTFAQEINGGPVNSRTKTWVIDGVYLKSNSPTKRLIPYEHVREADVIWSKRVWRSIDLCTTLWMSSPTQTRKLVKWIGFVMTTDGVYGQSCVNTFLQEI